MNKEIICVYQDCVMCGDRGKRLKKLIFSENLNVRKVSFASDEGKELIFKALTEHKIGSMPFFTDGERFSTNLADFVEKDPKNAKKYGNEGLKAEKPANKKKGGKK